MRRLLLGVAIGVMIVPINATDEYELDALDQKDGLGLEGHPNVALVPVEQAAQEQVQAQVPSTEKMATPIVNKQASQESVVVQKPLIRKPAVEKQVPIKSVVTKGLSVEKPSMARETKPAEPAPVKPVLPALPKSEGLAKVEPAKVEPAKPTVVFGGYIKAEAFADMRQMLTARDGHVHFFPLSCKPDAAGYDTNENGQFNMLAIQTRLFAKITGPDVGTAKLSGLVEGDFFGTADATINEFRMRHAMMRLDWKKLGFLAGYYWHPLFVETCNAADMIGFDAGIPFDPVMRDPQVRVELKFSEQCKAIFAALTEIDFKSTGPNGSSTEYIRNARVPNCHVQVQGKINKKHVVGFGVDVKRLRPRLVSSTNRKVDESVVGVSALAYAALVFKETKISMKMIYAANGFSYLMLGGYGITGVDSVTGRRFYTPTRTINAWLNIATGTKVKPGLFLAISKNLGARKCLAPLSEVSGATKFDNLIFGRGQDIDIAWRIAPRILWVVTPAFQVGAEIAVTGAHYGTVQQTGKVTCAKAFVNTRFLGAVYYYF